MERRQCLELWAELSAELRQLRHTFDSSEEGLKACEWFDEFLSNNELGLALDVLCDFLVDSPTAAISPEVVGQIERLRVRMGGGADRIDALRQRL